MHKHYMTIDEQVNFLKNEKKLSKKDYKGKLDVIQWYSSQSKVIDHLHHMLPYENWKPYSNWGKIE